MFVLMIPYRHESSFKLITVDHAGRTERIDEIPHPPFWVNVSDAIPYAITSHAREDGSYVFVWGGHVFDSLTSAWGKSVLPYEGNIDVPTFPGVTPGGVFYTAREQDGHVRNLLLPPPYDQAGPDVGEVVLGTGWEYVGAAPYNGGMIAVARSDDWLTYKAYRLPVGGPAELVIESSINFRSNFSATRDGRYLIAVTMVWDLTTGGSLEIPLPDYPSRNVLRGTTIGSDRAILSRLYSNDHRAVYVSLSSGEITETEVEYAGMVLADNAALAVSTSPWDDGEDVKLLNRSGVGFQLIDPEPLPGYYFFAPEARHTITYAEPPLSQFWTSFRFAKEQ